MTRPLTLIASAAALFAASALVTPSMAEACGGTFCDGGAPNSMPVTQTGETIAFVLDGGFVEAHVQINYDGGDAANFSWIVPVPEVPEVNVGSLQFIENLRNATVPSYGLTTSNACNSGSSGGNQTGIGFISEPDGGGFGPDDPEILELSTAGSFDYVILQGGTAETMMTWLATNGYAPNPLAPALFDEYIDEGSVFVAFKLNHFAGIEDLHPVVIRYPGSEPCIPLRLTAVAAEDNMDIRAFFLGEERVLPTNYRHVRLNSARIDWLQLGVNYPKVVARALNEAGGRAFMTEYAGTSSIVPTDTLDTSAFNPNAFAAIDPLSVVDTLIAQGLMQCTDHCEYRHDLVPLLLREFMPPPAGFDADIFYACLSCYERLADTSAWDAALFEARYREYITDPMEHATDLLLTWPYVTRLYTRMDAAEMTVDPMFAEVEGLSVVPNVLGAQQTNNCCNSSVQLPDGPEITLNSGGTWPSWGGDMPYAAVIQDYQPAGPPSIEVDNRPAIDALIAAHNAARACDGGSSSGTEGPTGSGDDGDTTGGASSEGPSGTTSGSGVGSATNAVSASGGTGSGGSGGAGNGLDDDGGCRTGGAPGSAMFWMLGLLGLASWRRRGA